MTPEFTSAPHGLAQWLICFGAILWIANQAMSLSKKLRGPEATPPNASLGESHSALRDRVVSIEKVIDEIWRTMRTEDSQLRREMSQFAQDVERAVGRLEGSIKGRSGGS